VVLINGGENVSLVAEKVHDLPVRQIRDFIYLMFSVVNKE